MKTITTILVSDALGRFVPRRNGIGGDLQMSIDLRVIGGPSTALGRKATLVLPKQEALDLAIGLIEQLPAVWLSHNRDDCDRLARLLKSARVEESEPAVA